MYLFSLSFFLCYSRSRSLSLRVYMLLLSELSFLLACGFIDFCRHVHCTTVSIANCTAMRARTNERLSDKQKPVGWIMPDFRAKNSVEYDFLWIEHDRSLLIKFAVVGATLSHLMALLLLLGFFFYPVLSSVDFGVILFFYGYSWK